MYDELRPQPPESPGPPAAAETETQPLGPVFGAPQNVPGYVPPVEARSRWSAGKTAAVAALAVAVATGTTLAAAAVLPPGSGNIGSGTRQGPQQPGFQNGTRGQRGQRQQNQQGPNQLPNQPLPNQQPLDPNQAPAHT